MPPEGRAQRVLTGVACILELRPFNLIHTALQVLFLLIRLSVVEPVSDMVPPGRYFLPSVSNIFNLKLSSKLGLRCYAYSLSFASFALHNIEDLRRTTIQRHTCAI